MTIHPDIALFLAAERQHELHEEARVYRLARRLRRDRRAERHPPAGLRGAIVIRRAAQADAPALIRLAFLDSKPLPAGALLVAEVDGEIEAAVPLAGGAAIANPFKPTADLVSLLVLRAEQMNQPTVPTARRSPCPTLT